MASQQVDRISGRFRRVATREYAEGAIVISHRWVDDKQGRRRSTGRWYRIVSTEGGRAIFRVLTFDPTLVRGAGGKTEQAEAPGDEEAGELGVDWSGWLALIDYADDTTAPRTLDLTRARWWHFPRIAITHPNPVSRVALQVSAVAFVLGAIPFLVSLVGWIAGAVG
ncbi:hypothetical protein [Nocardioides jensenii]|uniref:hypothetical protein n=1 Tax=Nocardioides jensenii TaxID=1843 RepID=UPI0008352442|nr:hypothetical protein [Nocardioides jensenii]